MNLKNDGSGHFRTRLYFDKREIDDIAVNELTSVGLLPEQPSRIRIDRFIEKRFGISPSFQELPAGLLGFSRFAADGCREIVVSTTLSESVGSVNERRVSSTLAHEAGHALLHRDLFARLHRSSQSKLMKDDVHSDQHEILCRSEVVGTLDGSRSRSNYQGEWWEYQANLMIGALLLPRPLLRKALNPILTSEGVSEIEILDSEVREAAADMVVSIFEVNPAVASYRIDDVFPPQRFGQLTL